MQHAESPPLNLAAKIWWTMLIAATLCVCYFSHLGAIGFVGPDEPRYAWIARAMAESGDWVTPRLYDKPWFEKPVLYYWGAAASFKLFGVSEAAARLPSALSALISTLALAWLAWRIYGGETARWLLLLLPTSVGMIGFSHAAATDMLFSGMLCIAMVCAAVVLGLDRNGCSEVRPKTPWLVHILFGFFLGAAVLAKGPAAIILCGGGIFFWALLTKCWRDAFRLFHPAAVVTFLVTALPWYLLCARRNPDFFRVFIIEHNFKRYLTPEFQHIQPFWFYVPVLLVAFLPWTVLLLSSSVRGAVHLWQTRSVRESTHFLVCLAVFCVLFFTISRSKLPGYVLPAIPPIGLLLAKEMGSFVRKGTRKVPWHTIGVGITLVCLGVAAFRFADRIRVVTDIRPAPLVMGSAEIMILSGMAVIVLGMLRRGFAGMMVAALAFPAFLILGTGDVWQLDEGVSARPAAMAALGMVSNSEISAAAVHKLPRGLKSGMDFYLRSELPEWQPSVRNSIVFTTHRGSEELQKSGLHCYLYIAFPAVEICADSSKLPHMDENSLN